MFSSITNDEQDHWNPMSSNAVVPPCQDSPIYVDNPRDGIEDEQPMGGNLAFDAEDEVEELNFSYH